MYFYFTYPDVYTSYLRFFFILYKIKNLILKAAKYKKSLTDSNDYANSLRDKYSAQTGERAATFVRKQGL